MLKTNKLLLLMAVIILNGSPLSAQEKIAQPTNGWTSMGFVFLYHKKMEAPYFEDWYGKLIYSSGLKGQETKYVYIEAMGPSAFKGIISLGCSKRQYQSWDAAPKTGVKNVPSQVPNNAWTMFCS